MSRSTWWLLFVLLNAAAIGAFGTYRVLIPRAGVDGRPGEGDDGSVLPVDPPRPVPDFELVDQRGRKVRRDGLLGRVWIADFIFTRCIESCPAMTARMRALQEALEKDPDLAASVRLVSFSVDPEEDTPERLGAYARTHGADEDLWIFLTGERGAVVELSQKGFLLSAGSAPAGEAPEGADGAPPRRLHSDRFALVDHRGRIRGYYRPNQSEEDLARLLEDVRSLVRELRAVPTP